MARRSHRRASRRRNEKRRTDLDRESWPRTEARRSGRPRRSTPGGARPDRHNCESGVASSPDRRPLTRTRRDGGPNDDHRAWIRDARTNGSACAIHLRPTGAACRGRRDRHPLLRRVSLRHPPGSERLGDLDVPDGSGSRDRGAGHRGRRRGHKVPGRRSGRRRGPRRFLPELPSCKDGLEQFCQNGWVQTYNSLEKDGKTPTYGGYASAIVVDEAFTLKVSPKLELPSRRAAPLRRDHDVLPAPSLGGRPRSQGGNRRPRWAWTPGREVRAQLRSRTSWCSRRPRRRPRTRCGSVPTRS